MDSKKLLVRLVFVVFFIFLLNYLALEFYWYSSIWYLDMPMHFLGGFWLGLILILFLRIEEISFKSILKIIIGVLLFGFLWEIFEIVINKTITENFFNILDTISDIFFDFAGGLFAILYFSRQIMSIKGDTV